MYCQPGHLLSENEWIWGQGERQCMPFTSAVAFDTPLSIHIFKFVCYTGCTDNLHGWKMVGCAGSEGRDSWVIVYLEITSRLPSGSVLGSILLHIFIYDLEEAMDVTLIKLACDTTLMVVSGEPVDTCKGRAAVQRERTQEWVNRSPAKFNKDKCHVLHLGRRNP